MPAIACAIPNLGDDVDTLDDLRRVGLRAGPRTQAAIGRVLAAVKVALLSGGVGGARFARGLVDVAGGANLTVVGNVGDDLEVLGMSVSPDLDSILYALAGLHDEERGWGRAGETWEALGTVSTLGGEDWFRLGDRDLGLHLVRTQALRAGEPLSAVTARLARALGIEPAILPATDDRLRTWIDTPAGSFAFQEWFVARGHRDEVDGVRFEGEAHAAPGVLEAIDGGRRDPDRAVQPVREHLADPRRAGDPRGARVPARALRWRSARSSAAARSRGRQTVCSRGWRAARHRSTSRPATRG